MAIISYLLYGILAQSQRNYAPKLDKPRELCNRVNIQFNNDIGGLII